MDVLRHINGNIGGLNPIRYIFWEDILTFTVDPVTLVGDITLDTGKVWKYLYATADTIQLEIKQEDTPAGILLLCQLKMQIPKDRADVEALLYSLSNKKLVIEAIDKNGICRYLGTKLLPMRITSKLLKPATFEGYNGWEVIFNGEFSSPPAYGPTVYVPILPAGT